MITREILASKTNWKGKPTRIIGTNEIPDFEIGSIINPGICWTDGGEFYIENNFDYQILFEVTEDVEGFKVDYTNEYECKEIGSWECEHEKEILINQSFEVIDFWLDIEESCISRVFLKPV